MRRKILANAEATAVALEPLAAPADDPVVRSQQAVAAAISPAVFPTEQFRRDTKAMIMREFSRPKTAARADAGSRDGTSLHDRNVVIVDTSTGQVALADMESISAEHAAASVEALAGIIAKHESRTRHQ